MTDLRSLRGALALVTKALAEVNSLPWHDTMTPDIADRLSDLATDIECWIEAEEAPYD